MPLLGRTLFLLVLVARVIAQSEYRPYFSLSTASTFGTHDKTVVSLSGYHVDAVQIRVYRIRDPIEFYRSIESTHFFGNQSPRPSGKKTLIETIHDWKRSLRASIRRSLRAQFTESPSAHFRRTTPLKESSRTRAQYFAQAPVLNQEQLILSFLQPVNSTTRWNSQQLSIGVKDKGVYLVEAAHGNLRAYTILNISDMVLVTKVGRQNVLGFVADRYTGQPISGVALRCMVRNGNPVSVTTDSEGLAKISVPADAGDGARIVAVRGADIAFGEIPGYLYSARRNTWSGYIYTDRPVYRPGDTMHFRGILRIGQTVGYTVPSQQAVSVQITSADGKTVYQRALTTNGNGIIHDEYSLRRGTALGNYFVQVKAGENVMSGNFEVQEYKKPEYDVRVTPMVGRVLEGENVQVTIDARYFFGEPVNGGAVKYAIYRSPYWDPIWGELNDDQSGEPGEGSEFEPSNEQIAESQAKLDAEGKVTVTLKTTVSDRKQDYRYRIEARVTDQANREISGTGWLVATYGSFLLNIQPDRYFFEPSKAAQFSVSARSYDGRAVSTDIRVEIGVWDWRSRKSLGVKEATSVQTDSQGNATATLTAPKEGGAYRVLVTARTPENRIVEASVYIWVEGNNPFADSVQRTLQIVPDKKRYRPGETAHILIAAGQPNTPVLVTIEGRDIRLRRLLRSSSSTATFDYSVSSDDEPAFFVNAQFIRNGEMFSGSQRVKVPPEDHKLDVKISTDKPQYLPGEAAVYRVDVTSADGKPVSGADLSLGVVDEAVYGIRPDRTPDIVNFFFGQEWNSVYTESSLQYFFSGEAGTRRMELANLRQHTSLAQLKPERLVQPKVRKAFPDTAFWATDLVTNGQGQAQTKVAFPDSLTTWRATARGAAPDERFGSGELKTIVRKNLIVRLATPRFLVQGDEAVVSVIVHNYLSTAKRALVSLKGRGVAFTGPNSEKEIEIQSRSEVKLDSRVKADTVRETTLTGQALTDEESDAIELTLPVNSPGVPIRKAASGSILNTGEASFTSDFPSGALPRSRSASVHLSASLAASLFGALDYLTSFPYGCVEQTMSSFLPDLMVSKSLGELKVKSPVDQEMLNQKIKTGLDRLYGFQHRDGGWGWWQSDESHPFMTSYVVSGLIEARSLGVAVKGDVLERGSSWLKTRFSTHSDDQPDLRAYIEYSLAVANQIHKPSLDVLFGERRQFSPYGMALLGLALEHNKDTRATAVASQIASAAQQNDAEAWWPATRDQMLDFEQDVTPEATAYAVKLLSHQQSNSPLLPKAVLWLMNHRNEGDWWSSTKQTAMVIYGLMDYLKSSNELHPDLSVKVLLNGTAVSTVSLSDQNLGQEMEISLDESKLQPRRNQLRITSAGSGRLYYSAATTFYSNDVRTQKAGSVSLNLLRDYFRLTPSSQNGRIVYDLAPLKDAVSPGDTLAVRLTVTGSTWRYLLAEDPIPAGTEFIERDNLYEIRDKPPWWTYSFTQRELHDDRMAIFQTTFPEGQQQFFYLLKVVTPGLFQASPARVGPMYQARIQATSEPRSLEVK